MREAAPRLPLLFGNVGAVQLNYGVGVPEIRRLIDGVGCDAFFFHLNPLQEAIQPEGDTRFSGLVAKLRAVVPELGIPGPAEGGRRGHQPRHRAQDPGHPRGRRRGGWDRRHSWSKIESLRTADPVQRTTGELFARWGIPTTESIAICRSVLPDRVVIASGGIRDGIEVAKAIALGADAAAMALPFLRAAEQSIEAAVLAIRCVIEELRTAMFVTGCRTVSELAQRTLARTREQPAGE